MDIKVVEARLAVNKFRIAEVLVNYYGLGLYLDICVYKDEKLWVRMPEIWLHRTEKRKFGFWFDKKDSDKCQEVILNKVFDMIGLDLESAMRERKNFFTNKKDLTEGKNNITFSKHSSEV